MKKLLILLIILFGIGIGTGSAILLHNYNKNQTNIYLCTIKYNDDHSYQYYSVNENGNENGLENKPTCQKKKKINCKNCEIIGNESGVEYNDLNFLLIYDNQNNQVEIYNSRNFKKYDSIKNVLYNEKTFQRTKEQVNLYNDSNLIGFIFPDKQNNDILYLIKNQKNIKISPEQEFYYNTSFTYYSFHLEGDSQSYDKNANTSKYITNISDGLIQVRGDGYQFGIYDLFNEKFLIPYEEGHFLRTNNGYIRYNQNNLVVTYYNKEGKRILSSDNNVSNQYNDILLLDIINEDLVLTMSYNKITFVDGDGEVIINIPLKINTLKQDFLKKVGDSTIKEKLNFSHNISEYYSSCIKNKEENKAEIKFSYNNNFYNIYINLEYEIDFTNNTIKNISN